MPFLQPNQQRQSTEGMLSVGVLMRSACSRDELAFDSALTRAPWSIKYDAISTWFFLAAMCSAV